MALLLGGAYATLALLSPKAALLVLLPVVALAGEMQVGGVLLRPDDLMLTILVVSWLLRRMTEKRAGTPLDRMLWAYVIVGVVATLWGAAIGTADLRALHQYSASGLHMVKRLQFVIYFFVLTDTLKSVDDVRRMVYVFMASLAGLSAFSMSKFREAGIALAPVGAAIHEPGLAAMLNVALALGLLVASKRFATSLVSGALLLGSLWVLPFSLGRNFILSTLAMLGLVATSRKRALLLVLPIGWLLAPLVLPDDVLARALSIRYAFTQTPPPGVPGAGIYVPDRLNPGLRWGGQVLMSSPLFGWGLGSVPLGSLDSEYANQFVATGAVGFLVFALLVRRIWRLARETYRAAVAQDSGALPFVAGLQHCLLGYALYSIFSPSISAARAGAFFFTVLGLLAVLHRELVQARPIQGPEATEIAGRDRSEDSMMYYRPGVTHQSGESRW
jgi:hypothetical protein